MGAVFRGRSLGVVLVGGQQLFTWIGSDVEVDVDLGQRFRPPREAEVVDSEPAE